MGHICIWASRLLMALMPDSPIERRDRGAIHLQLKQYARALRDLVLYVELAPRASDTSKVNRQIREIRQLIAQMN